MLKGISSVISPELIKVLMEMGHGDYIGLCDANCPAERFGKEGGAKVIHAEGIPATVLLRAILEIFPIDESYPKPFMLGFKAPYDEHVETPIWDEFKKIAAEFDERGADGFEQFDRETFCKHLSNCYALIQTGEPAFYGNIAIRKGCIKF